MRFVITLALLALVTGCAANDAEQGSAAQGGSVGATPTISINIGTGGGVSTTINPMPTAAPSAASDASSDQDATQETDAKGEFNQNKTQGGDTIKKLGKAELPDPVDPRPEPAPEPVPVD